MKVSLIYPKQICILVGNIKKSAFVLVLYETITFNTYDYWSVVKQIGHCFNIPLFFFLHINEVPEYKHADGK